jgi:signal peptidase I
LLVVGGVIVGIAGIGVAVALLVGDDDGSDRSYRVPSEAMEPTVEVGEHVDVDEDAYKDASPEAGDIVIFYPPAGAAGTFGSGECGDPRTGAGGSSGAACDQPTPTKADVLFIKRIVAGPGDTLSMENGHPVVNGEVAQEDFAKPCTPGGACNLPEQITIPPNHYFMLGDNRGSSDDSRFWGPIPADWIVGRVEL